MTIQPAVPYWCPFCVTPCFTSKMGTFHALRHCRDQHQPDTDLTGFIWTCEDCKVIFLGAFDAYKHVAYE